jgi:hypothetical protein
MDDSDLLDFPPVPLRSRRDGWTAERQRAFIRHLREGLSPGRAAAAVGMSRQTAYALRDRFSADGFAAAWDSATLAARRRRAALAPPSEWERAVPGVLRPVRYRGRIAAHERRFDSLALRRLLGRVDRRLRNEETEGDIFSPKDAELLSAFIAGGGPDTGPD